MASNGDGSEDMTPEQRMAWLRERGVQIETAEERQVQPSVPPVEDTDKASNVDLISYVHVPHDSSKPMQELSFACPKKQSGDLLAEHLKPVFGGGRKEVDLTLLREQATEHFGSEESPATVSEAALKQVASQGSVETFCLVHATPSNRFSSVNIYLDEVGMLKRLPLNKRASDFALAAGFNPPPQFYGDVFLGRIKNKPVLCNVSFQLGVDTAPDAQWLQRATMENLEHQTALNEITGRHDVRQASADGEDGISKSEGSYSWTQTEEEIEIEIVLPAANAFAKEIKAKFLPKSIQISFQGKKLLALDLYERVDPDGCTWTLDKGQSESKLIITCEKSDAMSWPRITH